MKVGQKYVGTVNYNVADKIKTTTELAKQLLESYREKKDLELYSSVSYKKMASIMLAISRKNLNLLLKN
jgi:beta-galactosidase beta subunit